jgi:hypothetical protein
MAMRTRTSSPPSRFPALALAATALLAVSCADNIKSDFPPGLDPLDAVNPALFPAGTTADPYPEQLGDFAFGSNGDVVLAYAKGYIQQPVTAVWAAGTDPQSASEAATSVDSCGIKLDVETGYDFSWKIHNSKTDVITIWFDVTWRSGTLPWPTPAGGPGSPPTVAWRFQKTDGTAYIQVMAGSVKAYEVAPGITGIEFIRHVNAARSPPDVVAAGIQNHYDNILAKLHSTPFTNRLCTGP